MSAVAVYEPSLGPVIGEQQRAARTSAGFVLPDGEVAALESTGYLEVVGRYVPVLLNDIQRALQSGGPDPADPALLDRISTPMLVLHGPGTGPFLTAAVRYVVGHVPNATAHEIPDAGHAAPLTHPEALGETLTEFFSPAQQPALTPIDTDIASGRCVNGSSLLRPPRSKPAIRILHDQTAGMRAWD